MQCNDKFFGQDQSGHFDHSRSTGVMTVTPPCRVVIFKNVSSHSRRRTLQAVDFILYLPKIVCSLLKNNILFKFPSLLTRQRLNANPSKRSPFSSASHALYVELCFTKIHECIQEIGGFTRLYANRKKS